MLARPAAQDDRRLSIRETAEMLGLTTRTISTYISEGLLPAYRVAGRTIRIRLEDIESLEERIIPTPSDEA